MKFFGTLLLLSMNMNLLAADDCPEADGMRCEFGDFYTEISFLPPSFEDIRYGSVEADLFVVDKSVGFRGGCFASTQPLDVVGPTDIDVSISYNGRFTGFIPDLNRLSEKLLFQLRLLYTDSNNESIREFFNVGVSTLENVKKIGTDENEGDYYFISGSNKFRIPETTTATDGASNIVVRACAVFPDVALEVKDITISTVAL